MSKRAALNEHQTTASAFQAGVQPISEGTDLNEDVKEEPSSPLDESEMCNADIDGDDDGNVKSFAISKRRTAHTVAEQKRRDAIKKGYDDLQRIVPTCLNDDSPGAPKMSKAVILQKSIDYLRSILEHQQEKESELNALKKEVLALQIMKANYEQIAKSTQAQIMEGELDRKLTKPETMFAQLAMTSSSSGNTVSDEAKFNAFKQIMETHFRSFDEAMQMSNFDALSASIFKWLEEECKPQKLQEIVLDSLRNTNIQDV